jgi:hypothetical protein
MEEIYARKIKRITSSTEKISTFLLQSPDFYFEMKWEFDSFIPLLSSIAPSDTCKIWKVSNNVRFDTTFEDFKKLKTIRTPMSYILRKTENGSEVFKMNNTLKSFFDPFEPLDEEEKELVINDVLNAQKINGEFKIKDCRITESKSFFGNLQFENVDGWKAKKYDVEISTSISIHNREKFDFKELEKNSYFDEKRSLTYTKQLISNEKDIKKSILQEGVKIENDMIKQSLMDIKNENDKKLKASVWIADNFPIKSSYLIGLINSISSANEFTVKIKEFLCQENVRSILEKNGFPVKIKIPLTFFLDAEITFSQFKEIPQNVDNKKLFEIPEGYKKITRKAAQNIRENHKKRLAYANFAI